MMAIYKSRKFYYACPEGSRLLLFADPEGRVVKAYEAFAVPLVLVVDASGVVRAVTLGYSSQRLSKMEKLVEKLLVAS